MDDLKREIERFKRLNDQMEAWAVFQIICQLLQQLIPGFHCPFSSSPEVPTIDQMLAFINEWEVNYLQN